MKRSSLRGSYRDTDTKRIETFNYYFHGLVILQSTE